MKKKLSLIVWTLLVVPLNLVAAGNPPLPAPLPQFMNQQQLAQWSAQQASKAKAADTVDTQFYTGKPYVAATGGYIHEYRTYDPEISRWTSADPSGFPDGVNNQAYAFNPVSDLDPDGCTILPESGGPQIQTPSLSLSAFTSAATGALGAALAPLGTGGFVTSLGNLISGYISSATGASLNLSAYQSQTSVTGNWDTTTNSWSNPGAVPKTGANGSASSQITLGGNILVGGTV